MTALAASAAGAPGTFFHEGFAKLAAPFLAGGVLETADVQVVDLVCGGRVTPEADVMLAFALAVRAPRHGHVGVDLATVRERAFEETRLGTDDAEAELRSLPWPEDPEAWLGRVRASPLVGTAGSPERRPFVLHDGLLMTLRWWTQQERLAAALQARLGCPELPVGTERPGGRRPVDAVELRRGLAALFPDPPAAMQRLAALVAVLRPLTVISGGPGTGKTSTVQKVLALLFAQWQAACGESPLVALAAPTGKAAVRMQEAMRKSPRVLSGVHPDAPD
ncbi:MAG: AAA family ATPase, partial [Deltaproteobacteria bacterium]|nr:AAA family ATPase [Deltaproteobacteria bacterium]